MLTNGMTQHTGPDEGELYLYEFIAEYGDYIWVQPVNGLYVDEGPLTFKKDDLFEVQTG